MKNKKSLIIILVIVLVVVGVYCLIQYLNPKIWIVGIKDNYNLSDFKNDYKLKSTLFVKKKETTWSLNGYQLYKGKKPDNLPITIGKNTLIIKNNNIEKT